MLMIVRDYKRTATFSGWMDVSLKQWLENDFRDVEEDLNLIARGVVECFPFFEYMIEKQDMKIGFAAFLLIVVDTPIDSKA